MTLGRILAFLALVASLLLFGLSLGLYLVTTQSARQSDERAARMIAESGAAGIEHFIALVGNAMEQNAMEPDVASALNSGDTAKILEMEDRLTRTIPGAALVRLVPDTQDVPDEKRLPRMGFADLDLVRQSRTGRPLPSVHVANTSDVHIALARRLAQADGAILASLSPGAAFASIPREVAGGAVELRQGSVSLAVGGDPAARAAAPDGDVPVQGTTWKVHYWARPRAYSSLGWFVALPGIGALLVGILAGMLHGRAVKALTADQDAVAKLVQDLLMGKVVRRSKMRLRDMQRLISQLATFKPVTVEAAAEVNNEKVARAVPDVTTQTVDLEGPLDEVLKPVEAPLPVVPVVTPQPLLPEMSAVEISATIFRHFDICGTVGDTLTPTIMQLLGGAIGSESREMGQQTVAVARDGRPSGRGLAEALVQGLLDSGCDVIDLGITPITVLYYATKNLTGGCGVLVTGGHERPDHNGLRIELGGERLAGAGIWKIRERVKMQQFKSGHGELVSRNMVADYIQRIVGDAPVARSLRVVVDCGNGATGKVAPALYRELGCEVVALFCEMDGQYRSHPPDPLERKNLEPLIYEVKEQRADLGIAFDADGDRLVVVDSSGKPIRPDRLLMLLAGDVLSREPGSDIIYDVRCSRHLAGYLVRHGGRPLMWKSERSLIMEKMAETGAPLAGDSNGRVYFRERWYGFDDGLYAAARLLEILSLDDRPSAAIFGELPESTAAPELTVPLAAAELPKVMARILDLADFPEGRVADVDGLRVDFADGFGLVRPADNQAALVLYFEAEEPEVITRMMRDFKALLKKAKPNLAFPASTK